MKEQARALVDTGLAECGYTYLNMDDGFFGGRDEQGILHFHKERFPNGIKVVAEGALLVDVRTEQATCTLLCYRQTQQSG